MHNQTAVNKITAITTRTRLAIPARVGRQTVVSSPKWTTDSSEFLRRAREAEESDGQLASKLLNAVSQLTRAMAEAMERDRATAEDCVQHACSVLLSCAQAASQPANTALAEYTASRAFRGGLAPWQVRSITAHIDANLNSTLYCETLASLAGLSVSHFARTFKHTFGFSPHAFLLRRRIERAQGLMLQSTLPLAQIATDCGFSDQAHFSRQFLQLTGESPGSWRRARACVAG
jgi:AraC family transcriptional regulator